MSEDAWDHLSKAADALDAALPDLFDAMIAAGRGPTDAEIEVFRRVKGTGSDHEWMRKFAKHAKARGSDLLSNHLRDDD